MAIDPTIALQAGQGNSPFGDQAKMPNLLANPAALNTLMTLGSNIAAGRNMQASIGPNGLPDFGKFNTLMAQDPQAALTMIDNVNKGLDAAGKQLEQQDKKRRIGLSAVTALYNDPDFQDQKSNKAAEDKYFDQLRGLRDIGILENRDIIPLIKNVPRLDNGQMNVAAMKQNLQNGMISLLPPGEAARANTGEIIQAELQNGIQYLRKNSVTGKIEPVTGVVPYGLNPSTLSQQIEVGRDAEGRPIYKMLGEVLTPDQLKRQGFGTGLQGAQGVGQSSGGASFKANPERQAQLEQKAVAAGFPPQDAKIMAAISMAESGGDSNAIGDKNLGGSYGVTQINAKAHGPEAKNALGNDDYAMQKAYELYKKAGNTFTDWTMFKNGQYKNYLNNTPTTSAAPSGNSDSAVKTYKTIAEAQKAHPGEAIHKAPGGGYINENDFPYDSETGVSTQAKPAAQPKPTGDPAIDHTIQIIQSAKKLNNRQLAATAFNSLTDDQKKIVLQRLGSK